MKNLLDYAFIITGIIMLVAGFVMILGYFISSGHESMLNLVYGFSCVLSGLFMIAFSVIVDAAFLYIKKNVEVTEDSEE